MEVAEREQARVKQLQEELHHERLGSKRMQEERAQTEEVRV